jgi:hypothetical protein
VRRLDLAQVSRAFPAGVAPGFAAVALLIVWAAHEGGFFPDTWYWGALAVLALLAVTVAGLGARIGPLPRAAALALIAFGLYVLWSYLSIAWASYPGAALEGSNRALLYWLVLALFAAVPWTAEAAVAALLAFVLGVGTIAVVLLVRLASGDHLASLFISGRLASPTGYYNASAALFTMAALVAIALAARRELPVALRAVLLALATAGLQLALIGQSRGWLFTLPLVAIAGIAVQNDRLRVVAAAALPALGTVAAVPTLLNVYKQSSNGATVTRGFSDAAASAGMTSLALCGAVLVVGALIALADARRGPIELSAPRRRALGWSVVAAAVILAAAGATVATHGRPFHFVAREWNGFSHPETGPLPSSNFAQVGSGRYDFWRVSLDALLAHPVGGLGQDNFAIYYMHHRRTTQQPEWTHSLELRLLAHTGIVGFALFATFLAAALVAALAARSCAGPLGRAAAGAALLPLIVWTFHGSVDWFWEFPALSGAALGFLGLAMMLERGRAPATGAAGTRPPVARVALIAGGLLAILAAAVALAIPYLAVRETAVGSATSTANPQVAFDDFNRAASINPLSADPELDAGVLALRVHRYPYAEQRFRDALAREPGDWEAWLGEGLAASALGDRARARHDLLVSRSINSAQKVTQQALARLDSRSPLSPSEALQELLQQL